MAFILIQEEYLDQSTLFVRVKHVLNRFKHRGPLRVDGSSAEANSGPADGTVQDVKGTSGQPVVIKKEEAPLSSTEKPDPLKQNENFLERTPPGSQKNLVNSQGGVAMFPAQQLQHDALAASGALQIQQTQPQMGMQPTFQPMQAMMNNGLYYFVSPSQAPGSSMPYLPGPGIQYMPTTTGGAPMQGQAYALNSMVQPFNNQQNPGFFQFGYNQMQPFQSAVQQNEKPILVGTGNTLAVAGAPAGNSDAESNPQCGNSLAPLAPSTANVTSQTQPFMSNGAPVLMKNSTVNNSGGMMIHLGGLGGVPGAAGLPPSSNACLKTPAENAPCINTQANGAASGLVPVPMVSGGANMSNVTEAQNGRNANLPSKLENLDELFGKAENTNQVIKVGDEAQAIAECPQSAMDNRKRQILKQQRWLLFLRHCAKCTLPETECTYGYNCTVAKQLWQHLVHCKDPNCTYQRCVPSRKLLKHHQKCSSMQCPVCAPVKEYVTRQREQLIQQKMRANGYSIEQQENYIRQLRARRAAAAANRDVKETSNTDASGATATAASPASGKNDTERVVAGVDNSGDTNYYLAAPIVDTHASKRPRKMLQEKLGTSLLEYFDADLIERHMKLIREEFKARPAAKRAGQANPIPVDPTQMNAQFWVMEEESTCKVCHQNKLTFHPESLYCYRCDKLIKRNNVYWATPDNSETTGHICHPCYNALANEDGVTLQGVLIPRNKLEKRKNDKEQEEEWVQCDACEGWVHMICGLFNKGRNNQERGYLCPPCLLEALIRKDRRVPSERPQAMLTARDLAKCDLSQALEERLDRSLKLERDRRAAAAGIPAEQVASAVGTLTVRVINNVNKRCEVKPLFASSFSGAEGYPLSFPYRQKVILLFQHLDGVDLCLYCLYVQEYGEDAPAPNTRTVYLSYLDSVKYFQPEGIEANGLGYKLRTMVYHEILLGYMDYAKAHGFTSMYIWSCPPLRGEDYIFYCHSDKQKNISQTRLREWYLSMLRRAKDEGIVVHITNLFDAYFDGGKDHRIKKPTILSLPYLDGDYWVGEAENILNQMGENGSNLENHNESKCTSVDLGNRAENASEASKEAAQKHRVTKAKGSSDLACKVLERLGEIVSKMKDDFIVVHMYECCTHCRQYINDSTLYRYPIAPIKITMKSEKTFDGIALDKPGSESTRSLVVSRYQLCEECYNQEKAKVNSQGDGSSGGGLLCGLKLEDFVAVKCPPIPSSRDTIPTIDNEFFDTRVQFLSLCQGNHYQFDSVRRARHSSMMVLYHLHNPAEPAFVATCNVCKCEMPPGEGYRCPKCDFDACEACYKNNNASHPHTLEPNRNRKFDETCMRLTDEERAQRDAMLQRTMESLKHASVCKDPHCQNPNCQKIKALFAHVRACKVKVGGGCVFCRKVWLLLHTHAKLCTDAVCRVPKCMEIRIQRQRQAARQDDMRRAAYRQMLKDQQQQ